MPTTTSFPEGFVWGTATAAHQVEGGNVNPVSNSFTNRLSHILSDLGKNGIFIALIIVVVLFSFLTDGIILQRYFELEGQLRRLMTVVKMRGNTGLDLFDDRVSHRLTVGVDHCAGPAYTRLRVEAEDRSPHRDRQDRSSVDRATRQLQIGTGRVSTATWATPPISRSRRRPGL